MSIISVIVYVLIFFIVVVGITFFMYPFIMEASSSVKIELFMITIAISEFSGILVFLVLTRRIGITLDDLGFHKPSSIISLILALLIAYALVELQIPLVCI